MPSRIVFVLLLLIAPALFGQAPVSLEPTPAFQFAENGPLTLHEAALPNHPLTVTGRSGAILGMQDGTVELWQLPVKLFSAMHVRAEVDGYAVPIELNPLAAELEVAPDHTTLTYSHAAIVVKQHMFVPASDPDAPDDPDANLGGQILFEVRSIHPATLVVSLTPSLVRMWPAPQWGQPGWDWRKLGTGGAYTLGTDNPEVFGMIGMPNATPGAISPYQEHPHTLDVEFRVRVDPARDAGKLFPLLCEIGRPGERSGGEGTAVLQQRLIAKAQALPAIYARTAAYWAHFFDHRLLTKTPDARFDQAMAWAELAVDKAQATIPAGGGKAAETGLVAGWYPSFDSARPGFGWFFGRDTLWSMYAIDSEGDAALARRAFRFLIARQRADGKMPHEFSETAESLTGDMAWNKLPYLYAAADATPLFLLAMRDYLRATGDVGFLQEQWGAVAKAYRFERTHDTDGDGVYDNSQGTGWVEDWPAQPHQELYLAALDRDATRAVAELAGLAGHADVAAEAAGVAPKLEAAVAAYRGPDGLYAFSKNADGSYDRTATVYGSVALWWSGGAGLPEGGPMLDAWAGHLFATDWGTRAVAETDPAYDPISYHRGSVWPLFTGWEAVAQYRTGRLLAGYAALAQNEGLTWAQDPGAVTEVLSGRFYEPLGRSSTHQMWSSAMVLAPAVREVFGVEPDAVRHTLYVHPHLPPSWPEASLQHVRVGAEEYTVSYRREGGALRVTARGEGSAAPTVLCLRDGAEVDAAGKACAGVASVEHRLVVLLPAVELAMEDAGLPSPGAETAKAHVVGERYGAREAAFTVEAPAGSAVRLRVVRNGGGAKALKVSGGVLAGDEVVVTVPAGVGWGRQAVELRW